MATKGEGTMPNIDRAYVIIALLLLVLGELLGFYMGASQDLSVRDTHVAMVLPGFVVLTLYGVLYRLWPQMKEGSLAKFQFWFAVIGALGLVIAAYLIAIGAGIIAAVIASALTIVGAALMAWLFWTKTA
jgi:peptidoglycan/LPS O-acetylase OafA/YrhL